MKIFKSKLIFFLCLFLFIITKIFAKNDIIITINNNGYNRTLQNEGYSRNPLGLKIFNTSTKKWKDFPIDKNLFNVEIRGQKGIALTSPIYSKKKPINWGVISVQDLTNDLYLLSNLDDKKKFRKSLIAYGRDVGNNAYISKMIWVPYKKNSDQGQLVGIGNCSKGGFIVNIDINDLFIEENDLGKDKWKLNFILKNNYNDYSVKQPFLTDIATDGDGKIIVTGNDKIWECTDFKKWINLPIRKLIGSVKNSTDVFLDIISSITYNTFTNDWYIYGTLNFFDESNKNHTKVFQIKIPKIKKSWKTEFLDFPKNDFFIVSQAYFTQNNYLLLNLLKPFIRYSGFHSFYTYPQQKYTKNTCLILKKLPNNFMITNKTEANIPILKHDIIKSPMYTCLTSDNEIFGLQLYRNENVSYFDVFYTIPNGRSFQNWKHIPNSSPACDNEDWYTTVNPKINPIMAINIEKYLKFFPNSPLIK